MQRSRAARKEDLREHAEIRRHRGEEEEEEQAQAAVGGLAPKKAALASHGMGMRDAAARRSHRAVCRAKNSGQLEPACTCIIMIKLKVI